MRIYMTAVVMLLAACGETSQVGSVEQGLSFGGLQLQVVTRDESGWLASTLDLGKPKCGADLTDNAFFQSFGTNDRACIHCHAPSAAWTITPELAQLRFTNPLDLDDKACLLEPTLCRPERDPRKWGRDPLFRAVDGATSPRADVSTMEARREAYKLLLDKGLIRVGMPVPADAEFTLEAVDDPYHYASAADLSLFRRPLPSTNLSAQGTVTLSAVMWDGRETDLLTQANDATVGHAQAMRALPAAARQEIVDFESSLHTAQIRDDRAGDLTRHGAHGGPRSLSHQAFWPGINDVFSASFDPQVFDLYTSWTGSHDEERAQVARGEQLFNSRRFAIRGVKGLNDALGQDAIAGTCTSCHDSPNYGHHSLPLAVDLGLTDASRRTADLPLYTLRNKLTGARVQTTDPGRALVTGRWKDVGKFKGAILRGLAGRAPYFHNGAAASLDDVVRFYDERFAIGLSDGEKRDLVAFLRSL